MDITTYLGNASSMAVVLEGLGPEVKEAYERCLASLGIPEEVVVNLIRHGKETYLQVIALGKKPGARLEIVE